MIGRTREKGTVQRRCEAVRRVGDCVEGVVIGVGYCSQSFKRK